MQDGHVDARPDSWPAHNHESMRSIGSSATAPVPELIVAVASLGADFRRQAFLRCRRELVQLLTRHLEKALVPGVELLRMVFSDGDGNALGFRFRWHRPILHPHPCQLAVCGNQPCRGRPG